MPASAYGGGSALSAMGGGGAMTGGRVDDKLIDDHLAVQAIIRSYQVDDSKMFFDGFFFSIFYLQGNACKMLGDH